MGGHRNGRGHGRMKCRGGVGDHRASLLRTSAERRKGSSRRLSCWSTSSCCLRTESYERTETTRKNDFELRVVSVQPKTLDNPSAFQWSTSFCFELKIKVKNRMVASFPNESPKAILHIRLIRKYISRETKVVPSLSIT